MGGIGAALVIASACAALVDPVRAASLLGGLEVGRVERALAHSSAGGASAGAATLGLAVALGLARSSARRRLALFGATIVLVVQGGAHALELEAVADRVDLSRPPALLADVPPVAAPARLRTYRAARHTVGGATIFDRIANLRDSAGENFAYPAGYDHVPGYDPALSTRFTELLSTAEGDGTVVQVLRLLGVELIVLPVEVARTHTLQVRAVSPDGTSALVLARVRPRASLVRRWEWVPDDAAASVRLRSANRDPSQIVITGAPGADERPGEGAGTPGACTIDEQRPERIDLHCRSSEPAYALLLDAWAPGWEATVDGRPARIERAEVVARAVAVPTGEHLISLRYRTPGLRAGLAVSGLAWCAWLALYLLLRRGRPPSSPTPASSAAASTTSTSHP
ncbi:MAG: hypothetical protein EXR72_17750 [Myxococcales bacterium]|nr:hypothetical protein [Myxococcales bacterium]